MKYLCANTQCENKVLKANKYCRQCKIEGHHLTQDEKNISILRWLAGKPGTKGHRAKFQRILEAELKRNSK